ncbi:MAG: toll/interleukin-1 receptor domain-containing protein [Bryobacterales bacterium]|nr:toll/interleukin-1 receptor domain-containing protein [Bryobacterales bacterium]
MREAKVAAYRRKRPVKVFLSHSYADLGLARRIRSVLSRHLSLTVFLHEDLSAGEDWQSKLRKELENTDVFVPLLTPNSVADSWVLQETGAAWALDKPIIPLTARMDLIDRFPIQLRAYQSLDLKDLDTPEGSERFAEALENRLPASRPA